MGHKPKTTQTLAELRTTAQDFQSLARRLSAEVQAIEDAALDAIVVSNFAQMQLAQHYLANYVASIATGGIAAKQHRGDHGRNAAYQAPRHVSDRSAKKPAKTPSKAPSRGHKRKSTDTPPTT